MDTNLRKSVFPLFLCVTFVLLHTMSSSHDDDILRVCAWNCRGIKSSFQYIRKLMDKADIIALSEHKLYEKELRLLSDISDDFVAFGRASNDLQMYKHGQVPGHCGVALLWRKAIASNIKAMPNLGTDRICVLKMCTAGNVLGNLYIISVYLPHSQCVIANYQYQIDALQTAVDVCSRDGRLLVIGDWNAHFGIDYGGRAWGNTSPNGRSAGRFASDNDMCIIDSASSCEGPSYTMSYCNENGTSSYIDHCFVSKLLVNSCIKCSVMEEETENTSDHLPLYVEVSFTHSVHSFKPCRSRTSWEKIVKQGFLQVYTSKVEYNMSKYVADGFPQNAPCDWTNEDIDTVYTEICKIIKTVDAQLVKSKYSKAVKPGWTERLSQLAKEKKKAWRAWSEHDRPREPDNPLWQDYKEAKRMLRRELRRHSHLQELNFIQEIDQAEGLNQDYFWKLINGRRKDRVTVVHPFQKPDGTVLTDVSDIRSAWGEYYKDLYTPKDHGFSETFKAYVDDVVDSSDFEPKNDSVLLQAHISHDEVEKVVKKLKNRKAAGPDGIQSEHLKMGGKTLLRVLTALFNAMIQREYRPSSMKLGLIVPIPKGKKDSSIPDNNRGITLTSILGKVYDSILVSRAQGWFHDVIDDLQGAKHKNCSSIHTSLLLREAIAFSMDKGHPVYTALLDVRKAFDQVWVKGLFYKLKEMKMDPKLWRILFNAYKDFHCRVVIGGEVSESFSPKQGIHQGDVWSMPLYCVYNNDLIIELKSSMFCTHMRDINCTCPVFVDDLTIIAWCKEALNQLLSIAHRYSRKWRFVFGADKCFVLVFGNDTLPRVKIVLGNSEIKVSDCQVHVGVPLCSTKKAERQAIEDRVSSARQTFFIIKALTPASVMLNPTVATKLYWSLCISKVTYGLEVWPVDDLCLQRIETFHNQSAKCIQCLPDNTPDPMCHAALNWKTIESHVDFVMLMFLWRLMALPSSCIYNKLFINRMYDVRSGDASSLLSPIYRMYHVAKKYGLAEYVFDMLESAVSFPKCRWRSLVSRTVSNMQKAKWHMLCMMYNHISLSVFPEPAFLDWWTVCKGRPYLLRKCKVLLLFLVGAHSLGCGKGKYINKTNLCQLCDRYVDESIAHFLLECPGLQETRRGLMDNVLIEMPQAMVTSWESMSYYRQTEFLLCEMGRTRIPEWEAILIAIIELVYGLYKSRDTLLKSFHM